MFDSVELYEDHAYVRIHTTDFDLIKQVSVGMIISCVILTLTLIKGLEETNTQLTSDLAEVKEENERLNDLLKKKERMWNDKINSNLELQQYVH
jgi:hypothetical protein